MNSRTHTLLANRNARTMTHGEMTDTVCGFLDMVAPLFINQGAGLTRDHASSLASDLLDIVDAYADGMIGLPGNYYAAAEFGYQIAEARYLALRG